MLFENEIKNHIKEREYLGYVGKDFGILSVELYNEEMGFDVVAKFNVKTNFTPLHGEAQYGVASWNVFVYKDGSTRVTFEGLDKN